MRRLFGLLLRALLVVSLAAAAAAAWWIRRPAASVPAVPPPEEFLYLDQGWGSGVGSRSRQLYYYTPQGATLHGLRYDWLVQLEMPWGDRRFADPAHLRAYGFVVDPQPTPSNPDQLPVGFTRRWDPAVGDALLDISCAACHTGQLLFDRQGRRTALRIDGGPASHALASSTVGHFVPALTASLASTYLNPLKFRRFGRRVLGERYDVGKWQLHADLGSVLGGLLADAWRSRRLQPVEDGPGRSDALARVANAVFARALASRGLADVNERAASAPVRFPRLWGAWKLERLEHTGASGQPMAHDLADALGAGASLTILGRYGRPVPAAERFRSSIQVLNLHRIETTLQSLQPPRWPEAALGPIDRAKAEKGRALFEQHCRSCHGTVELPPGLKAIDAPLRGPLDPLWQAAVVPLDEIGTDPAAALAAAQATVDVRRSGLGVDDLRRALAPVLDEYRARLARLEAEASSATRAGDGPRGELEAGLRARRLRLAVLETTLAQLEPQRVPLGVGLAAVTLLARTHRYDERGFTPDERACLDGFAALDLPSPLAGYVARPLAGVWAAGPYLHNGSVPTLYQLLSPQDERDPRFFVSPGAFDPVQVGVDRQARGDGFWFDTRLPGNANVGHEFRAGYAGRPGAGDSAVRGDRPGADAGRAWALVEYLKIHEDPQDPPGRRPSDCGVR